MGFGPFGAILGASVSSTPAASGMRSGFVRFKTQVEAESAIAASQSSQVLIWGKPVVCQWAKSNSTGTPRNSGGLAAGGLSADGYGAWKTGKGGAAAPPPPPSYGKSCPQRPFSGGKAGGYYTQEPITTIWVGSLPEGTVDADLAEAFRPYGKVIAATVHRRPSPQGSYSGFVRFATRLESELALASLMAGSIPIYGQIIVGQWAKVNSKADGAAGGDSGSSSYHEPHGALAARPPQVKTALEASGGGGGGVRTLFLANLPFDVTEAEVSQGIQEVALAGIVKLCPSKVPSRGPTAFVRFQSLESACEALDVLKGTPLAIRDHLVEADFARSDTFRA